MSILILLVYDCRRNTGVYRVPRRYRMSFRLSSSVPSVPRDRTSHTLPLFLVVPLLLSPTSQSLVGLTLPGPRPPQIFPSFWGEGTPPRPRSVVGHITGPLGKSSRGHPKSESRVIHTSYCGVRTLSLHPHVTVLSSLPGDPTDKTTRLSFPGDEGRSESFLTHEGSPKSPK